jgi:hypothetical protein
VARVGVGSARARCVPDPADNHRQQRSLADKSQRGSPALMQVTALAVAAFQAGHEGSIPFARSKPRSQVIGPMKQGISVARSRTRSARTAAAWRMRSPITCSVPTYGS